MRFTETYYSILDKAINTLVPDSIDLKLWIDAGVKNICVVLDSHESDLLIHFSGITIGDKNASFNDLFEQIHDLTDDKLTILISLYNRINGNKILEIINTKNTKGLNFEYLSSTNGYMIFHHQFERFLENEMGYEEQEAIVSRKSWNKKVIEEKEKVISNKYYDKLEGLMPLDFTFSKFIYI
jgi:hypothetical protein